MAKIKKGKLKDKIASKIIMVNSIQASREVQSHSDRETEKTVNLRLESKCKIVEHTGDKLILHVNISFGAQPKAIFDINIEYRIVCKLKEPIEAPTIEELTEIVREYGSDLSYLIAGLTDKLLGKPLVMPPDLEIDEIVD